MTDSLHQNPDLESIRTLLQTVKHIAVVGLSPKPNRPSHRVAAALQRFGYHIIPVRPAVAEVLGETAYTDLFQVTGPIDIVDVFRAPEHVDEIVDACIDLNIPVLWLQDGVVNEPAAAKARQHGIQVIMDRCMYRDYMALMT